MIIKRDIFNQIKKYIDSPEAIVITGMRRVGKTCLLKYIYDRIESENKIFLDLENPLNKKYFEEVDYDKIKSNLELLGLNFEKRCYLFLDEIQLFKKLPSIVKYLADHYNIKFFLTGSASYYLKNLFSESLAGRKYIFELFPLSFPEFLRFKNYKINIPGDKKISKSIHAKFSTYFDQYLQYGSFPEVVLKKTTEEKGKSLEDIFTSYYQLEVTRLGDFKKNSAIRDLILLLLERIGSKLDIKKISGEIGISRPTVSKYIAFLQDTYLIKTIKPYSKGKDIEIRKRPKIYFCDCGLAKHLATIGEGQLFENCIFQNLRLKGKINYYQRKSGTEIDFILNKSEAYEVKISPTESHLSKLLKLSKEIGMDKSYIISKNYSTINNVKYGFSI
ncbi:MAG: ATP-binding protein [Candidatus Humimicrobiaceae bacterium]